MIEFRKANSKDKKKSDISSCNIVNFVFDVTVRTWFELAAKHIEVRFLTNKNELPAKGLLLVSGVFCFLIYEKQFKISL